MAGTAREKVLKELAIGCGTARPVRAPRGTQLACRGWHQEAALRMLCNNLDPENAEDPDRLVVYGGTGRAARNWDCFDALVRSLRRPRRRRDAPGAVGQTGGHPADTPHGPPAC